MISCKQQSQRFDQNLAKLETALNSPDFLSRGTAELPLERPILIKTNINLLKAGVALQYLKSQLSPK